MPWWLALLLVVMGIGGLMLGIARGMRHKSEDIARTNRTGLKPEDIGWGGGTP